MNPQIKILHNIGNTIEIPNELESKASTYISDNVVSGVTSIPVDNTTDFSDTSTLLLLSSVGTENAEIVTSDSNTTKAFTTLATLMLHNRGDNVSEISWDQIVLSKCSTVDGTYIPLAPQTIFVTQQKTTFFDIAGTGTDYYKIQWKNSITGNLSDFSEAVSVASYPTNSVASIIYPVLKAMGISEDDNRITVPFCISAVNDARKFTAAKLYGIRQAWQQKFEHPIRVLAGRNYVDLPEDIDFSETDRSVLAARFIEGGLTYIDKKDWNRISCSTAGSKNSSLITIGDNTITLDNVGDFADNDSGVAYISTSIYTEEIEEIEYTGVDLITNQLTGVTGITRNIPAGTMVWSKPTISQPTYYTVFDEKLYFDKIIPNSMQGSNVYIDYYKKIDEIVNLSQELKEHYREMYKWYLRYAIKYRKDTSLSSKDTDLVKFEGLTLALFSNLYSGQNTIIIN